jgi:hypothetical protein
MSQGKSNTCSVEITCIVRKLYVLVLHGTDLNPTAAFRLSCSILERRAGDSNRMFIDLRPIGGAPIIRRARSIRDQAPRYALGFLWSTTTAALLVLTSGIAAPPLVSCGFDGLLGDGFSAEHSKSIAVAFAISDAVAVGLVDKTAIAPIDPGSRRYWRAVGRISSFQRLHSETSATSDQSQSISHSSSNPNWGRDSVLDQMATSSSHLASAIAFADPAT